MTKKILALLLAFAMMLALAACGGNKLAEGNCNFYKDPSEDAAVDNDTTVDAVDQEQDATQTTPEEEQDAPVEEPPVHEETVVPALNRIDFTLKNAGDSFRLEVENLPEGAAVTWSISDEAVATIAEDGTVTAVAHGTATAAAVIEGSDAALACIVRVTAETAGEETGNEQGGNGLAAFYESTIGKYEMPAMMLLEEEELLDNFFPGLTAVKCSQRNVYFNMMSFNYGEMAMAEAENAADVDAIKAAFQSRVDYMIENSIYYAESNEVWTNQSRVISVGNYVLMVASPHCDAIVDDFKAFVK